jgi:GNAT superfamily N-acetyltransferase
MAWCFPSLAAQEDATVNSPTSTAIVRDAIPRDTCAACQTLTAAFVNSPLGRWLDPDGQSGPGVLARCVTAAVAQAFSSGIIRVVEDAGRVVAAAVWSLKADRTLAAVPRRIGHDPAAAEVEGRWRLLAEVGLTRRPLRHPPHHLVLFGVHPDRQGEGLSSYLLIGDHALLHVTGLAAYVLPDESSQRLLRRHRYSVIGPSPATAGAGAGVGRCGGLLYQRTCVSNASTERMKRPAPAAYEISRACRRAAAVYKIEVIGA